MHIIGVQKCGELVSAVFNLFRWQTTVDFLALATGFYLLLLWAKETRAIRVVMAILVFHIAAVFALRSDLVITGWVLEAVNVALVVLLFVLFQPEMRHALMRLDSLVRLGFHEATALRPGFLAISEAAFAMARARVGAIIVIVRNDSIQELMSAGVSLGADLSPLLLQAIFQKTSPLHDGAVIVQTGRITRAAVVLPLTARGDVPPGFGTRHRAAMGIAERSDAVAIVVSEERGQVTLMRGREIVGIQDPGELVHLLQMLQADSKPSPWAGIRQIFLAHPGLKLAAAVAAFAVLEASVFEVGNTVRTVTAGVEFRNVPYGLEIKRQSADTLNLQLRGSPWMMGSISSSGVVARFDMKGAHEGIETLQPGPANFQLPPGVEVDQVSPSTLTVRISNRKQ